MSLGLKVAWRKKIDLICNLVCPLICLPAMLKSKCALVKHTNTQINIEESIHNVNYAGIDNTEEMVQYDACEDPKDDVNTQTLTTPKFESLENGCVYG